MYLKIVIKSGSYSIQRCKDLKLLIFLVFYKMETPMYVLPLARRVNNEIRRCRVPDMTLKKIMFDFSRTHNDIPNGNPAQASHDLAVVHLLKIVFGEGNPAIPVYVDFYNAAKDGEASFEQREYINV
jgi:hypothetical protein